MAERSIAAVLKTVELKGSWGSNPYFSAKSQKLIVSDFFIYSFLKTNILLIGILSIVYDAVLLV